MHRQTSPCRGAACLPQFSQALTSALGDMLTTPAADDLVRRFGQKRNDYTIRTRAEDPPCAPQSLVDMNYRYIARGSCFKKNDATRQPSCTDRAEDVIVNERARVAFSAATALGCRTPLCSGRTQPFLPLACRATTGRARHTFRSASPPSGAHQSRCPRAGHSSLH